MSAREFCPRIIVVLIGAMLLPLAGCATRTPLASWNDSASRDAIVSFVVGTTDPASDDFVPEAERIAVFDNDGTLWAEQPAYFQLLFALDRVREMAPGHPEWRTTQPFKGVLENDMEAVLASGKEGLGKIIAATHAGMTTEEFAADVRRWLATARHPKTGLRYTEMVYQPMLEVLEYLRANGYKTYIVSGGGVEFVRAFAEEVYGIPPEQVVGSRTEITLETRNGVPVLRKMPELGFLDDGPGKPVGIQERIGRRPYAAFGNSDGDLQMLQWTDAGDGRRLCVIVHHTDAAREFAYDRDSKIGHLENALTEARAKGWTVVDMRRDWKVVFPGD
ncbi:MAG: HAD family hydrolase [Phycisphaerales bacterium]